MCSCIESLGKDGNKTYQIRLSEHFKSKRQKWFDSIERSRDISNDWKVKPKSKKNLCQCSTCGIFFYDLMVSS